MLKKGIQKDHTAASVSEGSGNKKGAEQKNTRKNNEGGEWKLQKNTDD